MIVAILLLVLGLALLWFGADFIIEGAKKLAQRFKLSHAFVGLTIVSIGTSLPEISTTIASALDILKGVPASGIGIGVNIGACIGQITLVIGLVAYASVLHTKKKSLIRDGVFILFSILTLFIMGMNGFISREEGVILLMLFLVYLFMVSIEEREDQLLREVKEELREEDLIELKSRKLIHHPLVVGLIMLGGFALLGVGSALVLKNALALSESLSLTQSFVGVLIVGIGGFLPELSTAIKGILKKESEISLGVLIGSNITNPLFSIGLGAFISGFEFNRNLLIFDMPFWALSALLVIMMLRKNMRIHKHEKKQGLALMGLYALFVIMKFVFFRHA
ncbi:sodium:calcium antiporter [Candidatus Woesearchaeota archaeon]|nr:sodium:calcium antiporter [Candidatus Woesearchaeota archaeon]